MQESQSFGTPKFLCLLLGSKRFDLLPCGKNTLFDLMVQNGQLWSLIRLKSMSLTALLSIPLSLPIPPQINNPVVRSTLKVWTQFRKAFGYADFSILSTIPLNQFFTPSQHDLFFSDWIIEGIISFSKLFKVNCLLSFEELSKEFTCRRPISFAIYI